MAEFRLSPAAERDLEGIWKYTRDEWGFAFKQALVGGQFSG
jgi:toxin ParE1/3/4